MKLNIKTLAVFILFGFFANLIGNFISDMTGISQMQNNLLGQALVVVIPFTLFFVIWFKYGQSAAEEIS